AGVGAAAGDPFDQLQFRAHDGHGIDGELVIGEVVDGALGLQVGLVLGDLVTAGLGPRTRVGRAHCWHTAIVSSRRVGVTSVPCSRPSPPLVSAAPPATTLPTIPCTIERCVLRDPKCRALSCADKLAI